MTYQQLLDSEHIYDQSGINFPHEFNWEPKNGIYYPVKKDSIVESEFYQKIFNEAHNVGVDRCISFCESQKQVYSMIDPTGPVPMVIDSIIKTLAHFKKS